MKMIIAFSSVLSLVIGYAIGSFQSEPEVTQSPKSSCQRALSEKEQLINQIAQLKLERERLMNLQNPGPGEVKKLEELTEKMMSVFLAYVGMRLQKDTTSILDKKIAQSETTCPEVRCPDCPARSRVLELEHKVSELEARHRKNASKERPLKENFKSPKAVLKAPHAYYKEASLITEKPNELFERIQGNYEGILELEEREKGVWRIEAGLDYRMGEEGYAGTSYVTMINKEGHPFSRSRGEGSNNSFYSHKRDQRAIVIEASPDTFFRVLPQFSGPGGIRLRGTAYQLSSKSKEYEYIGKITLHKLSN